ncbi:MAG TPA: Fur family transcriptional regulator [Marinobacter sp.]|nr:Fur family transcriptional regulator [Marinobacter sp.]
MPQRALPYRPHNHEACVSDALADARAICRQHHARLTAIRERVLELIWQSHKPLGAYDILARLGQDGHKAAPPTVYRALDFLQQYGLVHRIASLNAFIGCAHAGELHRGTFLICRQCGNVLELDAPEVTEALDRTARAEGFRADDITLEIAGLCPGCQQADAHD